MAAAGRVSNHRSTIVVAGKAEIAGRVLAKEDDIGYLCRPSPSAWLPTTCSPPLLIVVSIAVPPCWMVTVPPKETVASSDTASFWLTQR
jgi:hypothetical protein